MGDILYFVLLYFVFCGVSRNPSVHSLLLQWPNILYSLRYPPVFNSVSNGVYRAECFLGLLGSSTAWTKTYLTYLTLPYLTLPYLTLNLPYIIEEDFNPTLVLVPFIYFLAEEGSCTAIKAHEVTRILIYLI